MQKNFCVSCNEPIHHTEKEYREIYGNYCKRCNMRLEEIARTTHSNTMNRVISDLGKEKRRLGSVGTSRTGRPRKKFYLTEGYIPR